jgi:hypothetical protein
MKKAKIIRPEKNKPAVVCVPGYHEVRHLSATACYTKYFLLARKHVPLSDSDRELDKEIERARKKVYGIGGLFSKKKDPGKARRALRELLQRRQAYEIVREFDSHGLFVGECGELTPAEILDLQGRRGQIHTVHYRLNDVHGKLVLPMQDIEDSYPIAVHGEERHELVTLVHEI